MGCGVRAERKLPSPRKQSDDCNSPQLQSSLIWFVLEGASDGLISTDGLSQYSWEPEENENRSVILLDTGCVGYWKWPRNLSLAEGTGRGTGVNSHLTLYNRKPWRLSLSGCILLLTVTPRHHTYVLYRVLLMAVMTRDKLARVCVCKKLLY